MLKKPLWLIATASILVAGCGGGGGGGGPGANVMPGSVALPAPVAPPISGPTVPLESAISTLYSTTRTYTLTQTDPVNGNVYDFRTDFTVGTPTTFESAAVRTVNIARSIKKNGAQFFTSSQDDYFMASPYRLVGTTDPNSSVYIVASGQVPLPATAKPGDSGKFYDTVTYDSARKNSILATSSVNWTVATDTATTVTFCANSVTVITQIPGSTTRSDCFKIDTAGTVPMVGFTIPK